MQNEADGGEWAKRMKIAKKDKKVLKHSV